ncbi:MAG: phage tail tube protein [Sterolibacterium sp.]
MSIASVSDSQIGFIAEATFGTTPTTPAFQVLRRTGGQLATNKGTVRSDEINSFRDVVDEYQVSQDVAGSLDFELSDDALDTLLQACLGGTWTSEVLKTGNTFRSFTFEERLYLGSTDYSYQRYRGCIVNTMELNIAARSALRGSMGIMGKDQVQDTAIISGATYVAANQDAIVTADSVGSLSIIGMTATPVIKEISLSFNNNARIRDSVGSLFTQQFGVGQIDITGRIRAYFESNALMQAVLDHDFGEISFSAGVASGDKFTFEIPKAQFLNGPLSGGGKDDDKMIDIDFRALYNSADSTSMIITRNVT